jgi:tRNA-modifying protein YgfZ
MKTLVASPEELDALERGLAFADLSDFRKVRIGGGEAQSWLQGLVTSDVERLEPGQARRTLLLTPRGRIRADFSLSCEDENEFLLLQAPDQPEHVGLILASYILSSDVILRDSTQELALFSLPEEAARVVGRLGSSPSVIGPGVDLVTPVGKPAWRMEDMFVKKNFMEAGAAALEIWRVRRGISRMGVDFPAGALPVEAGLEHTIDRDKGCFLGQESVAKVIDLGHPPRVIKQVHSDSELTSGMPIWAADQPVGQITSAAPAAGGGWVALVRMEWGAAEHGLTAGLDTELRLVV